MSAKTDIGMMGAFGGVNDSSCLTRDPALDLELCRSVSDEVVNNPLLSRDKKASMLRALIQLITNEYPNLNDGAAYAEMLALVRNLDMAVRKFELYRFLDQAPYAEPTVEHPEPPPRFPHFGLSAEEKMQRHWADTYHRLVKEGMLNKDDTTLTEWKYVCCGCCEAPRHLVEWQGSASALAYMVRRHLGGQWETAHQVFVLKGHQPLPVNLKTAHNPSQKIQVKIDASFTKNAENKLTANEQNS
jgi:hypothetical protein